MHAARAEWELTWEAHKYRARQHVHRLYLGGANAPDAPWCDAMGAVSSVSSHLGL